MLPSFLQKVEVVSEASRETCVALSDCLNLFTKQEGVGSAELNILTIVWCHILSSNELLLSKHPKVGENSSNKVNKSFILHQNIEHIYLFI